MFFFYLERFCGHLIDVADTDSDALNIIPTSYVREGHSGQVAKLSRADLLGQLNCLLSYLLIS